MPDWDVMCRTGERENKRAGDGETGGMDRITSAEREKECQVMQKGSSAG